MARHLSPMFSASRLLLARLAGAGAGFLTQLALARLMPAEDLGMFFAATSFAAIAGLALTQGYPGVMQRFMTRYRERAPSTLLGEFVWQSQMETFRLTLFVGTAVAAVGLLWPEQTSDNRLVIVSAAVCAAAASALTLYGGFAAAERRFELAQFPETMIRPVLFLPLIFMLFHTAGMTAGSVTALYAVLTVMLALIQYRGIAPAIPEPTKNRQSRVTRQWRAEARLFALAIMFATSFADLAILLATPFLGPADLAPFGVALKASLLVGFAVQVAHQVALPDLAEAQERGDAVSFARSLWPATAFPTVVTGTACLAAVIGGEWFLALFGSEYVEAKVPLVILLAAQFLRAAAGPGQSLLMLKGAQTANALICIACSVTLAVANAVLVPRCGIYGAALAVLITVALWFGAAAYVLARRNKMRVDLPFLLGRTVQI